MLPLLKNLPILLALSVSLVTSQLLNFGKNGDVGVSFGGYSASAGLGGVFGDDGANGGLHAEAGTPFGQSAGAGLGGRIEDDGTSKGGLYAGATAGGGVAAGTGLGGTVTKTGSYGGVASSGASGGHKSIGSITITNKKPVEPVLVEKEVIKTTYKPKTVATPIRIVEEVVEEPVPETVYVRKHVRRPHRKQAYYAAGFNVGANLGGDYQAVVPESRVRVVEKTVVAAPPPPPPTVFVQKYIAPAPPPVVVHKYVERPRPLLTSLFAAANVNANADVPAVATVEKPVKNTAATTYTASASINKSGSLFNDIFNIPIATLSAVNQLVNNIAGGVSVSATKHVATSANAGVGAYGAVNGHSSARK